MSEVGKLYEIWANIRGNWSLEQMHETEGEAVSQAKALLSKLGNAAVKILEVSFSENSQDYREVEIFTGGISPVVPQEKEGDDFQPFCTDYEAFYCGDAYLQIGKLLKNPLQQWKITVPELMYGAAYLKKLNDTGTLLQGAVQKVAIAQCLQSDHKTSERVLELYELTSEALAALKQAAEDGFPKIVDKDLTSVVDELSGTPQSHKMLMMALCDHFADYGSIAEKYDQVFRFIAKYEQPEIITAMDFYLAGYLANDSNVEELLGEPETFGASLIDCINLVKGSFVARGVKSERQELLNDMFVKGLLPECRKILLARIEGGLKGHKSFVQGNDFKNIMFHRKILEALQASDGTSVLNPEFIDILDARCGKMLGRETVAKILGPIEPVAERVQKLLTMSGGVAGANSRNQLARYFLPMLDRKSNERELVSNDQPVMVRLKTLRDMQKQVEKAGFFEVHTKRICNRLDEMGVMICAIIMLFRM